MGRRLLFCIIALYAFVSVAMAQITLTAESFRTVGHSQTQYSVNESINVGAGGANQAWTLPNYTWDDTTALDIIDPATMPLTAEFPSATGAQHVALVMGPVTYHMYVVERLEAGGYYQLGEVQGYGDTWYSEICEPEVCNVSLPFAYGDTHTRVRIRPDGDDLEEVDSTLMTADGWGTMTTPYGTHNVLRIAVHRYVKVRTISTGYEQVAQGVNYLWLDDRGVHVVTVEHDGYTADPALTNAEITVVDYARAAVEPVRGPVAQSFRVGQNYPNPFNPTTSLPVELSQTSRVTVDIYNEAGQLVSHEVSELNAGAHSLPVNGAAWATGTYFARVSTPAQSVTTKMQLLK